MTLVPVDIITGFLGSGKTTLIKHVLEKGLHGQRVAVIVNDLADVNVDGPVLRGMNVDKMVELSSGCVCCSGLYRLGAGLEEIVQNARPTLIVIETSGAADPAPVVAQLNELGSHGCRDHCRGCRDVFCDEKSRAGGRGTGCGS